MREAETLGEIQGTVDDCGYRKDKDATRSHSTDVAAYVHGFNTTLVLPKP